HFLKVAIADRIATIPAHRPQDHITLEMAPLEIRHRSVRPISAKHAQASRFLQQSRPPWRVDSVEESALLSNCDLRLRRWRPAGTIHTFVGLVLAESPEVECLLPLDLASLRCHLALLLSDRCHASNSRGQGGPYRQRLILLPPSSALPHR